MLFPSIVALQDINKRRQQVELPAVYFVQPNKKILKIVANDYDEGPDWDKVLYFGFTVRIKFAALLRIMTVCD